MRLKAGQIASHLLRFAYEPNGASTSAVPITGLDVGESRIFTGSMSTTTDLDVFKISSVPSGATITVDIDAQSLSPTSALDSDVRIFNSAGTQVAFNDDEGAARDSFVTVAAASTGDHYVGISSYKNQTYSVLDGSGLTTATTTGPYKVTISLS
jgi:serralysin